MKTKHLISLISLLLATGAFAIPNSERLLNTGARVTTITNYVYRITYTYFTLINGDSYNPNESPSSDYFLLLTNQQGAFDMAGDTFNASVFFIGEGFLWATGQGYFDDNFYITLPERWDGN